MKKALTPRRIVIIVSSLVLICVCVLLISERISGLRAEQVQQDVIELRELGKRLSAEKAVSDDTVSPENTPEAQEAPALDIPVISQDFVPLYEENNDFVGWLTAGEYIDFPVVQRDNAYYLRHNFFENKDLNGVPFLDVYNVLSPRDKVLVIHGHNMKSGAMFGRLSKYTEPEYLAENPLVVFRTINDEKDVYYTPIAAFHTSMNKGNAQYFDVTKHSFEDEADFQDYIDELTERSVWQAKTDIAVGDDILLLATCSYYFSNGRLILACRALRSDETPESVAALYADAVN